MPHPLYACYAESNDGIRWRKPQLGLVEFNGSKQNNIVLASQDYGTAKADAGHIAMFKDDNPQAAPEARYKAIVRSRGARGLLPFQSADGLRWSAMSSGPVITEGAFDSQNLAFWDGVAGQYRAYFRYFRPTRQGKSVRDIATATSGDFIHWSPPQPLTYGTAADEQLYTNQIKPYYRAPHLLIGFPTRYIERGWSESMLALPELEHRQLRAAATERYGTAITEGLLMSSRDGRSFERWPEAFLRPGIEREGAWNYGHQYIAWHVVETRSPLGGAPAELSLYAGESYWTGTSSALRRYTLRLDGFAALSAPAAGGEAVTRPLRFEGKRLSINFSSSAAGSIRVGIEEADGRPIQGYGARQCAEIFGDSLDRQVTWSPSADVGSLAGRAVRLRFVLRDADLYSFCFAHS